MSKRFGLDWQMQQSVYVRYTLSYRILCVEFLVQCSCNKRHYKKNRVLLCPLMDYVMSIFGFIER